MFTKVVGKSLWLALIMIVAFQLAGCSALHSGASQPQQISPFDFILSTVWFILLGVFVYFMLVLQPRFAKEDTHKKFLGQLKKQDEVVTSGGIFARVVDVRPEYITVEIAPNTRVKIRPEDVQALPAPPKVIPKSEPSKS